MICGGIDVGGTKIEARLFDGPEAITRDVRRVPTPAESFAPLLDVLADQVAWLQDTGGGQFPIGLSVAGLIDPVTGVSFASNIPSTGHAIGAEVAARIGRALPVVNDCMAFAYSEAQGGAGHGAQSVMGLILGTGVGGGLCVAGTLPPRHAGLAVEVGHLGLSARAAQRNGLPLWRCGCGREGCMELYVSGTGLANLSEWKLGRRMSAPDLLAAGTTETEDVLWIWADLAGDCLDAIQLTLDPECIVLGGGLSNMAGIEERLTGSLHRQRLGNARLPRIVRALHGDSSGARGAALIARDGVAP